MSFANGRSLPPRHRISGFRLLLIAGSIFAPPVAAARAETLPEAIAFAYRTNPDLLAQRAQLRAINERYLQARASLGFTVDGAVIVEAQHALVDSTAARGTTYGARTSTETLSVVQPLYTGGRATASIQAALANIFVAYQNVRTEENRILNEVVTAYVNVQRDQQIVAIDQENLKLLDGQIAETRAKLAVRESTLTDRDQGFARAAAARAQLVFAQAQLANSRSRFLAVVGRAPGTLAEAPPLPPVAPSIDEAFAIAEQGSPQLLSAEFQERASRAGISLARAATLPTVTLRGDVNQGPLVPYDERLRNNNQAVRVVVNVPIFSSGVVSSRVREARARNDVDLNEADSTRRQVLLSVATAWQQVSSNLAAFDLYDQQVIAQAGAYKGTKLEQRFALRSTLDALNAAQELNSARVNRAVAAHDAYAAKSSLLAAAGLLTPAVFGMAVTDDLAPDVKRLNRRNLIPWVPLIQALDAIGQPSVFDR